MATDKSGQVRARHDSPLTNVTSKDFRKVATKVTANPQRVQSQLRNGWKAGTAETPVGNFQQAAEMFWI